MILRKVFSDLLGFLVTLKVSWCVLGGHWDPPEGYPPDELSWESEVPVAMCLAVMLASHEDAELLRSTCQFWDPYVDCYVFGVDDRAPADLAVALLEELHPVSPRFVHIFYFHHAELQSAGHGKTVLLREAAMAFPEATHVAISEPSWRPVAATFNRLQLYVVSEGPAPRRGWPSPRPGEAAPANETCKIFGVKLLEGAGEEASWRWTNCIVSLGCAGVLQRRDVSPLGTAMPEAWVVNSEAVQGHQQAAGGNETLAALDRLVGFRMLPWQIAAGAASLEGRTKAPSMPLLSAAAPKAETPQLLASASYFRLQAVGDATNDLNLGGSFYHYVVEQQAEAEAMARGEKPFDCWAYHAFSHIFNGPHSMFTVRDQNEVPAILRLMGAALASPDAAWRDAAKSGLAQALVHLNRTTEAFALYSDILRAKQPVWANVHPQPPLPSSKAPIYIMTVASRDLEGLRNLIASVKASNVPCKLKVLGMGGEYKYHGMKLQLYGDFVRSLKPGQFVLGLDAYDTLVMPALGELPERFESLGAAVALCGEKSIWPDVGLVPFYPHMHYHLQPPGAGRYPFLNSGVFAGRADSLTTWFELANGAGPIASCGDDQRAFTRQYVVNYPFAKIDTEAKLFLTIHGAGQLSYWRDDVGVYGFRPGDGGHELAPAVLHFNSDDGKAAYAPLVEWWKESVRVAGLGHLLEVTDLEVQRLAALGGAGVAIGGG